MLQLPCHLRITAPLVKWITRNPFKVEALGSIPARSTKSTNCSYSEAGQHATLSRLRHQFEPGWEYTSIINAFGEGSSPSWPGFPASPWILDKMISCNGSVAKWEALGCLMIETNKA